MTIAGLYNYWIVILLMMTGFYVVISSGNLVKKIIGLNVFQASVFILYISVGKMAGGRVPILQEGVSDYSTSAPCAHPDGDCGGCLDNRPGARPGRQDTGSLRLG